VDLVVDSGDPAPDFTVVSTVILTVIGGLLVGLDMDAAAVQTAYRVVARGSAGRSVGRTDGTGFQLAPRLTARIRRPAGAGGGDPDRHRHRRRGLVPYAAPALWMGMGGASAASQVSVIRLLRPLLVAAIGVVATLSW
jgi:hypothetical protein